MSSNNFPKLRLGVMCTGPQLSLWARQCVDNMLATGHVELSLLILDTPKNYEGRSTLQKVRDIGFSKALFNIYLKTLYKPASLSSSSIQDWWDTTPHIECVVRKKGRWSQYFSEEDLTEIRSYDLDIVLRFGFNIIRGEILKVPRYGVWSYHHDDELKYRGGPPCFWEIYQRDPATGAILQRLNDSLDAGVILKKGWLRTKDFSYSRNVDAAYFESAKWAAWVVKDIVAGNTEYLNNPATVTKAPIYRSPTNRQFVKLQWIKAVNLLRTIWNRLFVTQLWNAALVDEAISNVPASLQSGRKVMLRHKSKLSFNADPFGFKIGVLSYIFYEELDYAGDGIGRIVAATFGENGEELERQYVQGLGAETHRSYPFVFEEAGQRYMIPESSQEKVVRLYRMVTLPHMWEPVATLMEGAAFVDTTLLRQDGKYWLFYAINEPPFDGDVHLHIAFSESLKGPYMQHPGNPVKISARSSRPAGTLFRNGNGELIRPAQNFTKSYGGSIVLNKVITLSERQYEEVELEEIKPFDKHYNDGMHNLAQVDEHTFLVDMKRHIFRIGGKK